MADEFDTKVSAAYRALGAAEPPGALDEAILAAARREAGAKPAPLAVRAVRRRWYAPLATAAVLVLAVAVTLNVQRDRPDIEPPAETRAKVKVEAPAETAKKEMAIAAAKPDARPKAPARAEREQRQERVTQKAPEAFPLASQDERATEAVQDAGSGAAAASSVFSAKPALQRERATLAPDQELERIAELRRQQKHDEADKALTEFRQRFPGYTITESMRERVERR